MTLRQMRWEEVYLGKHCFFRYDDETVPVIISGYDHEEGIDRRVSFFQPETEQRPYEGEEGELFVIGESDVADFSDRFLVEE